jgi:hypothetical protein
LLKQAAEVEAEVATAEDPLLIGSKVDCHIPMHSGPTCHSWIGTESRNTERKQIGKSSKCKLKVAKATSEQADSNDGDQNVNAPKGN